MFRHFMNKNIFAWFRIRVFLFVYAISKKSETPIVHRIWIRGDFAQHAPVSTSIASFFQQFSLCCFQRVFPVFTRSSTQLEDRLLNSVTVLLFDDVLMIYSLGYNVDPSRVLQHIKVIYFDSFGRRNSISTNDKPGSL